MHTNIHTVVYLDNLDSGVYKLFSAREQSMKLAPLPGLFFNIIQIHRLRFYNLYFNEIKYFKAY